MVRIGNMAFFGLFFKSYLLGLPLADSLFGLFVYTRVSKSAG